MIELCLSPYVQFAEFSQCCCGEVRQKFACLINFFRKFIVDPIIRYVSLNIIERNYSKPNVFYEVQTQKNIWIFYLRFCNVLAETNCSVLCVVLLSCLVSKLLKTLLGLKPKTVSSWLWSFLL
jgi:hypothetical protein